MWSTYNNLKAVTRVVNDKVYDYVTYYYPWNTCEEENSEDSDDYIDDFNKFLTVEKYTDEKNSKRIFNGIGFYNQYKIFFSEPTHIIDNIYLGSAFNAASKDVLKNLGINVIINMTKEISQYHKEDFKYLQYDLYDDNKGSIKKYLEQVYEEILNNQEKDVKEEDKFKNNIFIHCYMGASRSASVVVYYLMRNKNYTFDQSVEFLKSKRDSVNPTFRFTKDLAKSMYTFK
jgi:protein-tyrosine phosphatase